MPPPPQGPHARLMAARPAACRKASQHRSQNAIPRRVSSHNAISAAAHSREGVPLVECPTKTEAEERVSLHKSLPLPSSRSAGWF